MRRFATTAALCFIVLGTGAVRADSSTPKGAAVDFMGALSTGDAEGAKKHAIIANDEQSETINMMARLFSAQQKFQTAISKAFPQEAAAQVKTNSPEQMKAQIEASEVTETGDRALLKTAQSPQPMVLKKADGEWKIDVASMPELTQMKAMATQFNSMAGAMEATAADLDAGKFKSFAEAGAAFQQKMMAALQADMGASPAATQPGH